MSNVTRFMVLPDGTCAPLEGCMIIDVPNDVDAADEWIADNADFGYCLHKSVDRCGSYYELVNDLLMDYTDEQLMQTATVFVPGVDEYYPAQLAITDDSCDVLDENHIVITVK